VAPAVRPAVAADADQVAAVHVASWQWGATFVADLDGRVAGFVSVGPGRDDAGGPSAGAGARGTLPS
jgi:hypothetical protein